MPQKYIISVASLDRVGIVADVTAVLCRLNGNLEDLSQTVMRGYFSMILLAEMPDSVSAQDLQTALEQGATLTPGRFTVFPYQAPQEASSKHPSDNCYVLTASGPDRPGLVAAVTSLLREYSINVIDLSSINENQVYTMMYLIDIPNGTKISELQEVLSKKMADYGVTIGLRHQALFKMVNEI